jgi:adenylyltransferase/sulfurtransferase
LPKSIAAANHLRQINSTCIIDPIVADLNSSNAEELLAGVDLILDGTDNFETRYLVNDYAVSSGIPWIYGAAVGSYGLTMPVVPGQTACLGCVYPKPPGGAQPTCETAGVLNPITALIGALQVADALKILSGHAGELARRITTVDVWDGTVRQIQQPERDPACTACGTREFPYLSGKNRAPVSLCGRNAVQIHERARPLDLRRLQTQLAPLGDVRANEFALRFFTPPYEMTVFPDGRAIIKGTTDIGIARSLYARYIGA